MTDGISKAKSYGKYEIFDDVEAVTWEQAEALALKARGKDVPSRDSRLKATVAPDDRDSREATPGLSSAVERMFKLQEPEASKEQVLLNRALILLIHLRERVFKDDPEVDRWVTEILNAARA